ncbi:MAG: sugar ABC transporter ATP-binding protein [Oscillospiraceae bacterium]|nr:sugar ABC transporter ATP-binding protein [Oscillospiraceae bacterium]
MSQNDTILSLSDIRKSFFGVEVLHGISFNVKRGEIHGLVGENGAGKSTLMNVLGGVFPSDGGIMVVDGNEYVPNSALDATNNGIGFVHQELNLFGNLTVAENVFVQDLPLTKLKTVDAKTMIRVTEEYIEKFEVDVKATARVMDLLVGMQQMVEIVKVLANNARIVIFDEPTTSLSHKEKENLFRLIKQINDDGVTIIYISHILEDVFRLCDSISVLRDGNMVGTIEREEFDRNRVIQMMVGRELTNIYPSLDKDIGEVIYQAKGITNHLNKGVSFEIHKGEIVGMFGLMGAGRTELVRSLFGVDSMDSGTIDFNGEDFGKPTPDKCVQAGIAFITEDRRGEGLMMPRPIIENLCVVNLYKMTNKLGMMDTKAEDEESDKAIENFRIRCNDKFLQFAQSLSGGNQQKVVIGKWMMGNPEILILDEPTKGVDVGSKYDIYLLMLEMARDGAGVFMISSEMEELMGVCDRILVMNSGTITAEFVKGDYNPETIISYAVQEVVS